MGVRGGRVGGIAHSSPPWGTGNGRRFEDPGDFRWLAHLSSNSNLKRCPWGSVSSSRPEATPMAPAEPWSLPRLCGLAMGSRGKSRDV